MSKLPPNTTYWQIFELKPSVLGQKLSQKERLYITLSSARQRGRESRLGRDYGIDSRENGVLAPAVLQRLSEYAEGKVLTQCHTLGSTPQLLATPDMSPSLSYASIGPSSKTW